MTKKKNNRVSKIERFMYKSFIFMSLILVVGIILTKATLSQVNLEVQKLNSKQYYWVIKMAKNKKSKRR